ncbi:MAG: ABC transporter permease [Steroidobacteraceae bacterium]
MNSTLSGELGGSAEEIRGPGRVSMLRILWLESRAECLRLLRAPAFSVPVFGFPLLFYLLFAVALARPHAASGTGEAMLAIFVVFGVMAPGLFGLGVTLAVDRERGLLQLKRALPMPPGIYLAAKVAIAMLFAALIAIALMLLALLVGRVAVPAIECASLLLLAALGVLPFCGLGLLIGTLVTGQAAPAVINLVYLPMAFLSGVMLPLQELPRIISKFAPLWPSYHLVRLALATVGLGDSGAANHALVLAVMTAIFFSIARRRLERRG